MSFFNWGAEHPVLFFLTLLAAVAIVNAIWR